MIALSVLRDAPWLTASRARAYGMVLSVFLAAAAIWIVLARFQHGGAAHPPADDFLTFHAAGRMVQDGHTDEIYDMGAFTARLSQYADMGQGRLPFLYPPIMLIVCRWIATLPEASAYLVFEALCLLPLLFCLWRLLPRRVPLLPLLTAPALLMNLGSGQTGYFPALAYAGAAVLMPARPGLAGMSLGLLILKPHFALLVPAALAVAGQWRAFFACGATAAALCLLSLLALPAQLWVDYVHQSGLMKFMLEHGTNIKLAVGPFGALRAAGAGLTLAYAAQALCTGAVSLLVLAAAWRRPDGTALVALMASASVLVTPYAMDYDLAVIMVPLAWVARQAAAGGWRPWEKIVLVAAWLLPLYARMTVLLTGFQPAVFVLGVLLVLVWRRVKI